MKLANVSFLYAALPAVATYLWAQVTRAGLTADRVLLAYIYTLREVGRPLYDVAYSDYFFTGETQIVLHPGIAGGVAPGPRRALNLVAIPMGLLFSVAIPAFEVWAYWPLLTTSEGGFSTAWVVITMVLAALFSTVAITLLGLRLVQLTRMRLETG